jgi:predicted unusual protein kinase regulating ubiquinone biosynthesis (AarF/ABC1/UbiB family)
MDTIAQHLQQVHVTSVLLPSYCREARVMDTIAQHLQQLSHSVRVPRSVPGLVSKRLMVMTYMDGLPLLQLKDKVAHLPQWKREKVSCMLT